MTTTITNLTSLAMAVLTGVAVARTLGPDGRGQYAILMSFFAIALVICEGGQSASVTYYVSRPVSPVALVVSRSRRIMMTLGLPLSAITALVIVSLREELGDQVVPLLVALVGCVLNTLMSSATYALQSLAPLRWNLTRVLQPLVYLLGVVGLGATGHLTVTSLAIVLVTSTGAGMTAGIVWFARIVRTTTAGATLLGRPGSEPGPIRPQVSYGAREAVANVPITLSQNLDKLLLAAFISTSDLGLYAAAASVLALAAPFANALGSVFFPRVAQVGSDRDLVRTLIRRSSRTAVCVTVPCVFGAAIAGHWLMPALFGPDFAEGVKLLWFLAPVAIFRSLNTVASGLLRGLGAPGSIALAQTVGVVVSCVLIFVLAPRGGAAAAGLATASGELSALVLATIRVRQVASL